MAIRIEDNFIALEVDGAVVATARFSQHAAADGNGVDRLHPTRPAVQPQPGDHGPDARRALAAGYGNDDAFVRRWHKELYS